MSGRAGGIGAGSGCSRAGRRGGVGISSALATLISGGRVGGVGTLALASPGSFSCCLSATRSARGLLAGASPSRWPLVNSENWFSVMTSTGTPSSACGSVCEAAAKSAKPISTTCAPAETQTPGSDLSKGNATGRTPPY